jgi:hypothetical protein
MDNWALSILIEAMALKSEIDSHIAEAKLGLTKYDPDKVYQIQQSIWGCAHTIQRTGG